MVWQFVTHTSSAHDLNFITVNTEHITSHWKNAHKLKCSCLLSKTVKSSHHMSYIYKNNELPPPPPKKKNIAFYIVNQQICLLNFLDNQHSFPSFLLLHHIPQSFDWLTAFHPDLLEYILSIAVQLSAAVFLAPCGPGLPTAFFPNITPLSLQECLLPLVMPNCIPSPWVGGLFFFLIFKGNFSSFPFEKLHHSLFYLSIYF